MYGEYRAQLLDGNGNFCWFAFLFVWDVVDFLVFTDMTLNGWCWAMYFTVASLCQFCIVQQGRTVSSKKEVESLGCGRCR